MKACISYNGHIHADAECGCYAQWHGTGKLKQIVQITRKGRPFQPYSDPAGVVLKQCELENTAEPGSKNADKIFMQYIVYIPDNMIAFRLSQR